MPLGTETSLWLTVTTERGIQSTTLQGTISLGGNMSTSNDSTMIFQMIEAAEHRYANDDKRLQELKKLKRRVEEEIEDYGSPPPEEVVERLLSLIERGALPSEEQVLNVVENFLNSQQTTSETNEGNFIQDAEDLIDRGETDKALHLLEESVSRMPRNWKPFVRKPPQPRRDEANGSETPRKWKPIVVQLDGEIAFWDEEEFQSYSDYVRGQVREDAIKSFLWISPSYSKAHYLIASLAIDQGDFKKALNALDAGLALEPDHPDLMCEKAYLLKELGRREDALAYYQSAASARLWITDSAKARALRGQGRILIDLGRLDEAEEAFKQSLTLEPESKLAREGIAFIEKHQQMSPDTSRHRQANRETVGSITHKPVSRQVAPSPPSLKRPSKQGPNLRPVAPTETARSLKRRSRQVAPIAPSRTNTSSKHRKIWFVFLLKFFGAIVRKMKRGLIISVCAALVLAALGYALYQGWAKSQPPKREIVITNEDGSRKLVYNCDQFKPQAKSLEDARMLMRKAIKIMRDAQSNYILSEQIDSALEGPNYTRLERLIFEYECQNLETK